MVGRSQILVRLPSLGQGRAVLGLSLVEERQGPVRSGPDGSGVDVEVEGREVPS